MPIPFRPVSIAVLVVASVAGVRAQQAVDPTGHWQGAVQAPGRDVAFEVDLSKNAKGDMIGTIDVPGQKLKGLPLTKVSLEGHAIAFHARTDQPLRGVVADDGQSISGDFLIDGASLPFSLTRAGEPRIEPPATSAPIGRELEGTWNGTLAAQGFQLRLVLTMANQADGTAVGRIVNLDEGGLELPVRITQKAAAVTLDSTVVASSFSGQLNAAGTELSGTFTQGAFSAPLTFQRAASDGRK